MAPEKVTPISSHHIDSYAAAAEQFKVEFWNLCIALLDDDFPLDWLVGMISDTALNLQLLDDEE